MTEARSADPTGEGGPAVSDLPTGARTHGLETVVDTTRRRPPYTRHMYGALQEEIRTLISDSLWSEVLGDRKFYWPITNDPVPDLRWKPLGPADAISMNTQDPYVGDQSPAVQASGPTPAGIQQAGLSLAPTSYEGRIVARGDASADVSVELAWGDGAADRQSVRVPVQSEWATVPLHFECRAATTSGSIAIIATGTGRFEVGAISLMPAGNIHGFRRDTTTLLREIRSGVWRWPGGNYVSGYDWRDGVGDPDRRPPRYDHAWNTLVSNDVGTDEFMTLCELIGAEPNLCVNTGFGSAREAAQYVEYVNGSSDSEFGRLRAANGHPDPYGVKLWGVGNEMYGYWQLGYMPAEHYTYKHNMFARAMRKVDPSITLIIVGAMPDEVTIDSVPYYIDPHTRKVGGQILAEYGSPSDWTYRMLTGCKGNFDIISEHCYGDARRLDQTTGQRIPVEESVIDSCRRVPNRIRLKREYWDLYTRDFPELVRDQIKVAIDEWGFRNAKGVKQTLGIAMALHELFRNTDFITLAAFTMGSSWLSYTRTEATYSNSGLLFLLYGEHFGTTPLDVRGNSPQPPPKWPVGGDQPKVNAGSPTYPLDIAAALTADDRALTVAVVNATESPQSTRLELVDFEPQPEGQMWRLEGPSLDATNAVGNPPEVAVTEHSFPATSPELSVPPYCIELYRFTRA